MNLFLDNKHKTHHTHTHQLLAVHQPNLFLHKLILTNKCKLMFVSHHVNIQKSICCESRSFRLNLSQTQKRV